MRVKAPRRGQLAALLDANGPDLDRHGPVKRKTGHRSAPSTNPQCS